jgi:hypothetical protein
MDVLVHIDPEDNEGQFEHCKPLTRRDVQILLDRYLADIKASIEDFRIHYLNGQIEVEIILPFALSEQPQKLATLKKRCKLMQEKVKKINNVILFFKQNED